MRGADGMHSVDTRRRTRRARQTPTRGRRQTARPPAMLLLFETPAGFSLFKVKDEKKLDDVEVRVRNAIGGFLFRRPAARVNCGFYDSSIPLRVGFTWTRARRRARVVRDGGVSYGDTGDRGVRGYRGTVRSREEDRFDCREKGKARARARIERARTALCRSIGFGTRRLGFVRGVDVSRNVLLFD